MLMQVHEYMLNIGVGQLNHNKLPQSVKVVRDNSDTTRPRMPYRIARQIRKKVTEHCMKVFCHSMRVELIWTLLHKK